MNIKKLIDELSSLHIVQTECDVEDNIPEPYSDDIQKVNKVACGLDADKHRWYETAVDVFEIAYEDDGMTHLDL